MNWTKFETSLGTKIYMKTFATRTRVVLPSAPLFNQSFSSEEEALAYVQKLIEGEQ